MRVVLTGSSGLIGTALRHSYTEDGHTVLRLVRRECTGPDQRRWDPTGSPDPALLGGADVVINLAGAGLGDRRWSPRYKRVLMRSRVDTTRALVSMIDRADLQPRLLLSMSGIRYYGVDRGDLTLTETAEPSDDGFLPTVTRAWEEVAAAASVPVVHLRMGLVLARDGGLLPRLRKLFRLGLGGKFGTGREFWSYLTLTDAVRAIRFLAEHPAALGPYNISTPYPVRGAEFAAVLARMMHRPAVVRYPTWSLRLAMGQMAPEVLGSLRVLPTRLLDSGFQFAHPAIVSALHHAL